MPNTYTGWPVIPSGDARLTVIEPVPGRRFTVLAGPVATVLDWLIRRFHAEVEPIDQGILDDYGYNYRKVRGSDSWSNHASGTAVDLNATKHPFKTRADQNFSPAQIAAVRQILADATINGQQVVRWLDANDPMHFEINYVSRGGTPENVAKLAARLAGQSTEVSPAPEPPAGQSTEVSPAPEPPAVQPRTPRPIDWTNPDDGLVRITQEIVGAKVDGIRGPKTKALTLAHQRKLGLAGADSLFGPKHAEAYLLSVPNLYRSKPDREMPAAAVKLVQWIGRETPDGSFGAGTEKAVMEMQAWLGLPADGNVGADTKKGIVR